jgi:hypothetical protein
MTVSHFSCYAAVTMPAPSVFALVLSLLAAGAAAYCVSLVRVSTPQALQIRLKEVQAMLDATQAALEAQNGRLTSWRQEMEALYEAVEGTMEVVEKKRRQTAAAASRMNPATNGEDPNAPSSLVAQARAAGFDV